MCYGAYLKLLMPLSTLWAHSFYFQVELQAVLSRVSLSIDSHFNEEAKKQFSFVVSLSPFPINVLFYFILFRFPFFFSHLYQTESVCLYACGFHPSIHWFAKYAENSLRRGCFWPFNPSNMHNQITTVLPIFICIYRLFDLWFCSVRLASF